MTILAFDSAGASHRGCVRPHNEDAFVDLPGEAVWAVADGMGGHSAGDVASRIIAEEIASLGTTVSAQDQRARLSQRLDRAHQRIRAHAAAQGLGAIGSTVAALLIHDGELTCIWAGDSRIYLLRDGALTRLTRDHSEVAEMVAAGLMTETEARTAPRRNVITRAIGAGEDAVPELATGVARAGDLFLLCSDGLTGHLEDAEIAAMLAMPSAPALIVDALIGAVLDRGATDNVTAVVLRCQAGQATGETD
ncbi:MAG: protein phosphatase 2C domain-containing protein [Paracoccus sp. (in: a-proteobacteria)]|nr:protein phosphatase 2C domain-containing protein [Paracoccus sp. (in: a-proteobacteria)]